MFPKGRQLRRNNCIFKALCAAIREFGIAALFISTESDRVRLYPEIRGRGTATEH